MIRNKEAINRFIDGVKGTSGAYKSTGDKLYFGRYSYRQGFFCKTLVGITDLRGRKIMFTPVRFFDMGHERVYDDVIFTLKPKGLYDINEENIFRH